MLRLMNRQRGVLGEKALDLANFAATALVFGQFVGQQPVSVKVIVGGVATWIVLALVAIWLTGDR